MLGIGGFKCTRFVLALFTPPIVKIAGIQGAARPRFLIFWLASERKKPRRLSRLL
jgi:hypothetical protein